MPTERPHRERKRVDADVLFRDEDGRILTIDPRGLQEWRLPGGGTVADEAPLSAARREVLAMLGLDWPGGRLLVVDWSVVEEPDDMLAFVFDGGVLVGDDRERCALDGGKCRFCTLEEASWLLSPLTWDRANEALAAVRSNCAEYLHHGRRTW